MPARRIDLASETTSHMSAAPLRCWVEQDAAVTLVRVYGPLTMSTAPTLRSTVLKCLSNQPELIVADVSAMDVDDDIVLSVLPALARHAAAWPGAGLALGAPGPRLAAALDRMAVCRYVPVYPSVSDAVDSGAERIPLRAVHESLEATPSSLAVGRAMVARACAGWQLSGLTDLAQVVMTELVANAVRHAGTPMEARIALRQRYLHLSVRDRSFKPPRRIGADHEQSTSGRGLLVVEALAASWGSTPTADGKVVWATLHARNFGKG